MALRRVHDDHNERDPVKHASLLFVMDHPFIENKKKNNNTTNQKKTPPKQANVDSAQRPITWYLSRDQVMSGSRAGMVRREGSSGRRGSGPERGRGSSLGGHHDNDDTFISHTVPAYSRARPKNMDISWCPNPKKNGKRKHRTLLTKGGCMNDDIHTLDRLEALTNLCQCIICGQAM